MKILLSILFFTVTVSLLSQDLHEEVQKVFNFTPHTLSKKEQDDVFPKLDSFFKFVLNEKDKYVQPLREELKRKDNNPYFYFDGSNLLMHISKTKEDYQLVADALTKCDLRDIPTEIYLSLILDLSLKGANVIDAALKILDDTTYTVFVEKHALTLHNGENLKVILPRYPHDLYLDKLIDKFEKINSLQAKISCLDLFIIANSCRADAYLMALEKDYTQDVRLRDYVTNIMKLTKVTQRNNIQEYNKKFEERKVMVDRLSDEMLGNLQRITIEMRKYYKCN